MAPVGENAPSSAPLYQTDLAQTPLAEILVTIHKYKVPGVVECRRGDEVKRVYLDRGRIVFATTNQISESLGDMLLAEGRITREQYEESIRRVRDTKKRHGVTLVEMRLIAPDQLFVAVQRQIHEILWSLFSWTSGSVTFTPGRDKNLEFVKVDMCVPYAVIHGVRRMPDARAVTGRLGNKATLLAKTGRIVDDLELGEDEQHLLDAVDGKRALYDLVQQPPLPPGENARLLYAFFALQLIAPVEAKKVKIQVQTPGGRAS